MAQLIICLDIDGQDLDSIMEVMKLYINPSQPKILQVSCRRFFADLLDYDPITVYLKVMNAGLLIDDSAGSRCGEEHEKYNEYIGTDSSDRNLRLLNYMKIIFKRHNEK